ncbi:unnamed protein product [Caenorhabditis sp. 36 PRJEB53466]|nr:unnamed protein product [Caenorhabditis sp. 36 PRJEB53466]
MDALHELRKIKKAEFLKTNIVEQRRIIVEQLAGAKKILTLTDCNDRSTNKFRKKLIKTMRQLEEALEACSEVEAVSRMRDMRMEDALKKQLDKLMATQNAQREQEAQEKKQLKKKK